MSALAALLFLLHSAWGADIPKCQNKIADEKIRNGFQAQAANRTLEAIDFYNDAIKNDPKCDDALYEIGWSFWKLGEWEKVVSN